MGVGLLPYSSCTSCSGPRMALVSPYASSAPDTADRVEAAAGSPPTTAPMGPCIWPAAASATMTVGSDMAETTAAKASVVRCAVLPVAPVTVSCGRERRTRRRG